MDQVVSKCLHCGSRLKEPRKLKDFCSYSCRGRHSVKALDGPKYEGAYLGSKNTKKTKALRRLKTASREGIAFERINPFTIRLDQPHKRAVGWMMEVSCVPGKRRWVAWVGNHRSEPLTLEQAKEAARGFLTTKSKAEPRDFIQEHNQLAANEVDRAYWAEENRKWPLDLMEGQRQKPSMTIDRNLRQAILDTERVVIDEKPTGALRNTPADLEHFEDGYPKLPDCLRRD
jgi:hypothetical protein